MSTRTDTYTRVWTHPGQFVPSNSDLRREHNFFSFNQPYAYVPTNVTFTSPEGYESIREQDSLDLNVNGVPPHGDTGKVIDRAQVTYELTIPNLDYIDLYSDHIHEVNNETHIPNY